ncbi:HlyD family efflux transporter periplasmic adaptor subunit [Streptococcus orisasini]|uniref:HlyD family efflux transporter periplasmic adaptor subunit n=1 Tax=Streptococcus orisasini TaxID=1080071 RepID=UPI000708AD60|nr:HlyD family efflux transporter periplasmic adaptor subunit [Streptococcus orisasini]
MDPKFLQSAEFYKRRYHNFATLLIVPLVCLIIFLIVFLCFAKKEITVISAGEVTPTKIVSVIQSYSDTSIVENNLNNNTSVKKGDLLVEYSENANSKQQEEQRKIVEERQERKDKKKDKKNKKKDKKKKKNKKKKKSKDKKSDRKKSDSKKSSKKEDKDKDSDRKNDQDKDHKDFEDSDEVKKVSIFAAEDGIIHTTSKYDGVNLVPKWTEMAQIYPDIKKTRKVLMTYYVSSDDVVSMEEGQKVRLSLEKKGNDKITVKGKINNIASSATTTKKGNVFKVTAKVKLSKKDSKLVKYGMTGKTVTVTDKKTYFNYFKDKLLHKLEN